MTEKYTLRDILVYALLGLTFLSFCFLHFPFEIINTVSDTKDYSDLTILLLIPLCYLIGHLLMSIDDLVFNGILKRFLPKERPLRNKWWRFYNFIFFGNRNIGIRNELGIKNEEFLKTCDKLISEKNYEKAEYYQIMSDFFKGFVLIIIFSFALDLWYGRLEIWKLLILFLGWYRARMFSSYYVRIVKRKIEISNLEERVSFCS